MRLSGFGNLHDVHFFHIAYQGLNIHLQQRFEEELNVKLHLALVQISVKAVGLGLDKLYEKNAQSIQEVRFFPARPSAIGDYHLLLLLSSQ